VGDATRCGRAGATAQGPDKQPLLGGHET